MINRRYWLIGALVSVAVFILLLILTAFGDDGTGHLPAIVLPLYPGLIIAEILFGKFYSFSFFVGGVISGVLFFIIGAFLGWLYGKFKNIVT